MTVRTAIKSIKKIKISAKIHWHNLCNARNDESRQCGILSAFISWLWWYAPNQEWNFSKSSTKVIQIIWKTCNSHKNSCIGQIPPCLLPQERCRRELSEPIVFRIQNQFTRWQKKLLQKRLQQRLQKFCKTTVMAKRVKVLREVRCPSGKRKANNNAGVLAGSH